MAYLTYEEYQALKLIDVSEDEFEKVLMRATMAINAVTNFKFIKDDTALNDYPEWYQRQFKLAVAMQMEYVAKSGIETAADAREQGNITSSSIGSTSISMSGGNSSNDSATGLYMSPDVMNILASLGLLYTGVDYVR